MFQPRFENHIQFETHAINFGRKGHVETPLGAPNPSIRKALAVST
jgi:hypothetical protein